MLIYPYYPILHKTSMVRIMTELSNRVENLENEKTRLEYKIKQLAAKNPGVKGCLECEDVYSVRGNHRYGPYGPYYYFYHYEGSKLRKDYVGSDAATLQEKLKLTGEIARQIRQLESQLKEVVKQLRRVNVALR